MSYSDYTPPGPWTDGQSVTRNVDSTVFTYSASNNALYIPGNIAGANKNINGFRILGLPAPTVAGDIATKEYVDNAIAGIGPTSVASTGEYHDALSVRSSTGQ